VTGLGDSTFGIGFAARTRNAIELVVAVYELKIGPVRFLT
jgi:hypothetical protein